MKKLLHRFRTGEDGTATVESVLWIPIFVWILVLIVNASMIIFEKNQAYRIVQNANRILSTGYMQTEAEVESYIAAQLQDIAPSATVTTTIANGVVTSDVSYQVSDVFMPHVVTELLNVWVTISAQHFMEY